MRFQIVLTVDENALGNVLAFLQKPDVDVIGIGPAEPPPARKGAKQQTKNKLVAAKDATKSKSKTVRRKSKSGGTGAEIIAAYGQRIGRPFSTNEVSVELGKHNLSPTGANPAIYRAIKKGVIEKDSKGLFRLVQAS